jgi:hypothetical protein
VESKPLHWLSCWGCAAAPSTTASPELQAEAAAALESYRQTDQQEASKTFFN